MKNTLNYLFKKKFFFIFLLILILLQISNLSNQNIHGFNLGFNDLKWSGSNLFFQKKNIYEIFYSNNYENQIIGTQFPNYLISSIYFHLPLGYFEFDTAKIVWTIFSTILLINCYLLFDKKKFLVKNQDIIIFFSFITLLISKPFNMLISNGNFSIVCFWALNYFFLNQSNVKTIPTFLVLIKYSFAPILILYSILQKKIKILLIVLLINILLLFHFSYLFSYNFFQLSIDPLIIGSQTTASGFFDLQTLFGNHPSNITLKYLIIILISLVFYLIIYRLTLRDTLFDLCLLSLATLIFFKHLYYDQVLLLPLLIYSFKLSLKSRVIILSIIFYYWFIAYLEFLHPIRYWKSFMLFNNSLCLICIYLIFNSKRLSKKK